MLRIEGIFEEDGIRGELEAYNPLIPDGGNWKATMLIEYPEADERRRRPAGLEGIEDPPRARDRSHGLGGALPALRARREEAPRLEAGGRPVGRRRPPELPRQRERGARSAGLARGGPGLKWRLAA